MAVVAGGSSGRDGVTTPSVVAGDSVAIVVVMILSSVLGEPGLFVVGEDVGGG
jgi:hypothetical protein